MRVVRDSSRELVRNTRNRRESPAGRAADGAPRHPSCRSARPALERPAGLVDGPTGDFTGPARVLAREATTGTEAERVRERSAAARARPKVHGSLYATPAHVPPSAARKP